jgi:hypothetical protein
MPVFQSFKQLYQAIQAAFPVYMYLIIQM